MKTMKFHNLKNFVIVVLVIAAVYQTGMLWLGNSASHNFFYAFFNAGRSRASVQSISKTTIDPESVVVGYGNKSFNVTYPGLEGSTISKQADKFISNVIKNRDSMHIEDTVFEKYIDRKCVVYDFAFDVSAAEYFYGMGYEDIAAEINVINHIISVPATGNASANTVYLVDDTAGKTAVIVSEQPLQETILADEIDSFGQKNIDGLRYISTIQSGLNIFKNNLFVPQWTQKQMEYSKITKVNAVKRFDDNIETALEGIAAGFSGGYSGATVTGDEDGVYMISDENVVLKYYPDGFMEYYSYEKGETDTKQTLSTAYYACKEFLAKDKSLNTKLYLSDVQLRSDGLVFCFDYSVNDVPVVLSEEIRSKIKINYAAEVVIENNKVKKYKRYTYDFLLDKSTKEVMNVDFVGAMNEAIAQYGGSVTKIDDIVLGYYDCTDAVCMGTLKWLTFIEEKIVPVDAKLKEDEAAAHSY